MGDAPSFAGPRPERLLQAVAAIGGFSPSPLDPNPTTILQNFDGLTTADVGVSNFAADSSGAIGPNHYFDSANFSIAIYDRSGTRLLGPSSSGTFWNGFATAPCGGGWSDVVVLYDRTADRWFVSRFAQAPSNGPWYQCFAISQTPDPTGQYYGSAAPPAFKGFAATLSAEPPACRLTWTTPPGNSSKPPATIPSYMAVVVSSAVTKAGSAISGNVQKIVIVQTAPGYASNPGHAGTGLVVATLCQ